MEVTRDINIIGHKPAVFIEEAEERAYYDEIIRKWAYSGSLPFLASAFYNLGKLHGTREERARRKAL